jgi:hypothetical protein
MAVSFDAQTLQRQRSEAEAIRSVTLQQRATAGDMYARAEQMCVMASTIKARCLLKADANDPAPRPGDWW